MNARLIPVLLWAALPLAVACARVAADSPDPAPTSAPPATVTADSHDGHDPGRPLVTELGAVHVDPSTLDAQIDPRLVAAVDGTIVDASGAIGALEGDWQPVAFAPGPGLVALIPQLPAGATIYEPGSRSVSEIAVHDLDRGTTTVHRLDGNVVPEAFSHDGRLLFVIDHQPATDPTAYRVRLMDWSVGALSDVLGPLKTPIEDDMLGTGRRQLGGPDGRQLFTLYSRQPSHHGAASDHDHVHGFVHVLDLEQGWAVCLDLPPAFGQGSPSSSAMAIDELGGRLLVADAGAAEVAVYGLDQLDANYIQARGIPVPLDVFDFDPPDDRAISAAFANGQLLVSGGADIIAVDLDRDETIARLTLADDVRTLVPDGDAVYALTDQLTRVDLGGQVAP